MTPVPVSDARSPAPPAENRAPFILFSVLLISAVYFLVGSPGFYRRFLEPFGASGRPWSLAPPLYHFGVTVLLFLILPAAIVRFRLRERLFAFGWRAGDLRAGLVSLSWGVPLVLFLAWISSRHPEFQRQYPLFLSRPGTFPLRGGYIGVFAFYQAAYFFYYVGWEFFFRGYALFGLREELGVPRALLCQTAVSSALHLTRPAPELLASLPGGVLFGLVALRCRSLGAVIVAHWLLGFSLDLLILLQTG